MMIERFTDFNHEHLQVLNMISEISDVQVYYNMKIAHIVEDIEHTS